MTDEGTYGWLVLLGGLLAGAAGLFIFTIGRSRLLYDLHKIPGPAGWPLLGNALDVIGSKILHHHQVRNEGLSTAARDCLVSGRRSPSCRVAPLCYQCCFPATFFA